MNKNKWRSDAKDPPKTITDQTPWDPPETHLHTPSGDTRSTAGTKARHEGPYSILTEQPPPQGTFPLTVWQETCRLLSPYSPTWFCIKNPMPTLSHFFKLLYHLAPTSIFWLFERAFFSLNDHLGINGNLVSVVIMCLSFMAAPWHYWNET